MVRIWTILGTSCEYSTLLLCSRFMCLSLSTPLFVASRRIPCQEALDNEPRQNAPARGKVVGLFLLHEMPHGGRNAGLGAGPVAEGLSVPLLPQLPPVRQHRRPAAHRYGPTTFKLALTAIISIKTQLPVHQASSSGSWSMRFWATLPHPAANCSSWWCCPWPLTLAAGFSTHSPPCPDSSECCWSASYSRCNINDCFTFFF